MVLMVMLSWLYLSNNKIKKTAKNYLKTKNLMISNVNKGNINFI